MYLIKRSLLVSIWFVFLTLPLLAVKVDTTNETLIWRWENMLYVGVISFVLYMIWMLALRWRSRQRRSEEVAQPRLTNFYGNITDNKLIVSLFNISLLSILVVLPLLSSGYQINIWTTSLIYVIIGLGLNIVVGFAGQLVLGYAAFYAVGAYTFGLLYQNFGVGFWVALPCGAAIAGLFGVLVSLPVIRLRGDYLAIVTLGFGEITRLVLENWIEVTNGPGGISNIPRPALFNIELSDTATAIWVYYIVLFLMLVAFISLLRLKNSRVGRSWIAVSEDETASEVMGINTTWAKLTAFALSAVWAGIAGVLFATKTRFINPDSFTFMDSAMFLCIVVLGGMGSVYGMLLGAFAIALLPEYLRAFSEYRMLMFGAAMTLMMIFRPQGLIPPKVRRYRISKLMGKEAQS
ncbi:MAG: branched-chain amino acid ABC transporter permease [Desulfovibrionaceae bacterium]|nr:branched-chain amino acid ABC transporter permease [Desulfovibrionaceae bacterium]